MAEQTTEEIYRDMSSVQKAALLLIALGQRWATEIMRVLKPDEVKMLSYWINRMAYVPQELTERIIRDFYERLVRKTSLASSGGREYLLDILGGMMGEARARELVEDLSTQEEQDVFRVLRKIEPKQLAAYLKQEQPQTVALLLSYLDPSSAASVIGSLPEDRRVDIIVRLAKLQETDPEVIAAMERTLTDSLGAMATGTKAKKMGGPKIVAEILNNVAREMEKEIMDSRTPQQLSH